MNHQVEIDYRAVPVEKGDTFVLATDGVYEYVNARFIAETIHRSADDLGGAAKTIIDEACRHGSPDNLTVQVVRIDKLPDSEPSDIIGQDADLPCPPLLEARVLVDGYQIVREIHASSRSHIYLAIDTADGALVAIKTPSIDLRGDPAHLQRFRMEEWVARRINSAHVLKPRPSRKRNYLYVVTEFIDGQTLTQWMIDNPRPSLETVRGIVEQIAKGLQAFHRMEMLHQDLRPENIMIDRNRHREDHRFRLDENCRHRRRCARGRAERHPGDGAIHGAGILPGRRRFDAFGHLLARRHHLSDADRPAAVRRPGTESQNEIATTKITVQIRPRRQSRDSRMDRRHAQESRASRSEPTV